MTKPISLMRVYASRQRKRIGFMTLTFILSAALLLCAPQALSRFIDAVYAGSPFGGIAALIAAYLALTLTRVGAEALLNVQVTSVGRHIANDCRRDVLKRFLSLDTQTLSGWNSGEAMTRIDEDVDGLFKYYYILFYKLTGSGVVLAAILAALAFRSLWLSAALLIVSVVFILVFKRIQDRGVAKYVRSAKASAEFNGVMKELLSNAAALRAMGAEAYGEKTMRRAMRRRYEASLPASLMYGNLWSAATLMECAVIVFGLVFAAALWDKNAVSLGTAYMIYTYASMICDPLQDFRNHMGSMQDARAGILRTLELLNMPSAANGESLSDSGEELPDEPLDIVIENLRFTYAADSAAEILRGVSLTVPAGHSLGLMGETGCGKSTLISCVAGMNHYLSGSIRIGGHELSRVAASSLRKRIAYCAQRVRLLHATLRENIALYDEAVSDSDIQGAVQALGLESWLAGFPRGLDTELKLGQDNLSSGEARLIGLLRLALKRPRVILLDEITAGLDAQAERRVTSAVRALCEGRTVIAIAHSAEALDWMDALTLMSDGMLAPMRREGVRP